MNVLTITGISLVGVGVLGVLWRVHTTALRRKLRRELAVPAGPPASPATTVTSAVNQLGPAAQTAQSVAGALRARIDAWCRQLTIDEAWTALLIAGAYALSYNALYEFAGTVCGFPEWAARIFPLIIDGITIYAAIEARRAMSQRRLARTIYAWSAVIGLTVLSGFFQYVGTPDQPAQPVQDRIHAAQTGQRRSPAPSDAPAGDHEWAFVVRLAHATPPFCLLVALEIRNRARARRQDPAALTWRQERKLHRLHRRARMLRELAGVRTDVQAATIQMPAPVVRGPQAIQLARMLLTLRRTGALPGMSAHDGELRPPADTTPATTVVVRDGGTPPDTAASVDPPTPSRALPSAARRRDTTTPRRPAKPAGTTRQGRSGSRSGSRKGALSVSDRRDRVAELYQSRPGITDEELNAEIDPTVNLRTIQRDLEWLRSNGRISRRRLQAVS